MTDLRTHFEKFFHEFKLFMEDFPASLAPYYYRPAEVRATPVRSHGYLVYLDQTGEERRELGILRHHPDWNTVQNIINENVRWIKTGTTTMCATWGAEMDSIDITISIGDTPAARLLIYKLPYLD